MFPDPLRAFRKVVQSGSIRKASEQMALAPSSVSRQIAILERQMGTELFKRSISGLVLTHAGHLVAKYADEVIAGFDTLRLDLNDLRGSKRLIRVNLVESIVSGGPAQAIERFSSEFSEVSFELHVEPAAAVVQSVREERCDLGISFSREQEPDIQILARVPEPLLALVPDAHPLVEREALTLEDLAFERIALPDRAFGVRKVVDQACYDMQIDIRPMLESNSFEALRDFVRTGVGIAILPKRAAIVEQQGRAVRCISIDHPAFRASTLDLLMLKQSRVPRLLRLFSKALAKALHEHDGG